MTAIVGILNRRGLAFAADSAATHRSKTVFKISNNANKIFSLSKYHPVGVAIYSNLDFIGTPWDSIIKLFRNNLKDKKYDTLQDYVKPFFDFVRKYCLGRLLQEQKAYASHIISKYYNEVYGIVKKAIGDDLKDDNADSFFVKMTEVFDGFNNKFKNDKAEDFATYKQTDFEKYTKDIVDATLSTVEAHKQCPVDLRKKFNDSLFALVCHNSHIYLDGIYTGLVFFGYGDKDLFPSLLEYKVTYALGGHIKYTLEQHFEITSAPGAAVIAPFAQTDVANTVVRAVEDKLRQQFYNNYRTTLQGLKDEVITQLDTANAPESLVDVFKKLDIDKYASDYQKGMDDYIDKSYIRPLMDTVAYLDKEDLADMAESLVRMTCLKRHVTAGEETVGGPVDVAIVTKGDGFIWKKRKHYFDPELNSQFFERYKK